MMTAHQTSECAATPTPWLVGTTVPLTILNRYDFRGEGSRLTSQLLAQSFWTSYVL